MRFAKKPFSFYWPAVKWSVIVLSLWILAGFITFFLSLQTYKDIFMQQWIGFAVFALGSFIAGYLLVADFKGMGKESAWAGALTGLLISVPGIFVGFILLQNSAYMDMIIATTLANAASQGQAVTRDMIEPMIKIGGVISIIFSPVLNGLVGALFGWLGGLVAKKVEK